MQDQGNAGSWWRPYVGKYEVALEDGVSMADTTIMLSTVLDVIFTSDMEIAGETTVLATLPDDCRPATVTYIPVLASANDDMFLTVLQVDVSGEISIHGRLSPTTKGALTAEWTMPYPATLHLNGSAFNICGKYYRKEV